jgi:hypothetical protein
MRGFESLQSNRAGVSPVLGAFMKKPSQLHSRYRQSSTGGAENNDTIFDRATARNEMVPADWHAGPTLNRRRSLTRRRQASTGYFDDLTDVGLRKHDEIRLGTS